MSEAQVSPDDLDKWFEELEASLDTEEVARLAKSVIERHKPSLEEKVLADFHGNAPIIDSQFDGKLPTLTAKAKIFIIQKSLQIKQNKLSIVSGKLFKSVFSQKIMLSDI